MANGQSRIASRHLNSLLGLGTLCSLTDGQLLERFMSCRGESAESAFAALVERHGPMVMGICRRVLSDPHDAEDAFQATFLVLVRRADSVRIDDSLGRWLHGVGYRVAIRSRALAARRRRRQGVPATEPAAPPTRDVERLDLRAEIDAAIDRLPEKYRAPVVLFHLEGLSHEATARALGCPLGTVQGRLARARERLRAALTRRGLAPAAGFLAIGTSAEPASACIPALLLHGTVRAATRVAAGE
jgi:RNA polymerase sigma factor (sigma-70 family)